MKAAFSANESIWQYGTTLNYFLEVAEGWWVHHFCALRAFEVNL